MVAALAQASFGTPPGLVAVASGVFVRVGVTVKVPVGGPGVKVAVGGPGVKVSVGDGVRVRVEVGTAGVNVAVGPVPWKVSWNTRLPPLLLYAETRKKYVVPPLAVNETRDCAPLLSSLQAPATGA